MTQISEETKDLVLSKPNRYFTIKKFAAKNRENGTWPGSEATIWALRSGSPAHGIDKDVFLKVGRRVLVDEEKFWVAISRLQED